MILNEILFGHQDLKMLIVVKMIGTHNIVIIIGTCFMLLETCIGTTDHIQIEIIWLE